MPTVARGGAFLPHCLDGEALPTGRVESIWCSGPELRDTGGVRRSTGKSGRAASVARQCWKSSTAMPSQDCHREGDLNAQAAPALARFVQAGIADIK